MSTTASSDTTVWIFEWLQCTSRMGPDVRVSSSQSGGTDRTGPDGNLMALNRRLIRKLMYCSLNTASNFIRKWFLFGYGDWYGHGDGIVWTWLYHAGLAISPAHPREPQQQPTCHESWQHHTQCKRFKDIWCLLPFHVINHGCRVVPSTVNITWLLKQENYLAQW